MSDSAVLVRKGRKFEQVLDGARTVFMADGFEGASVDDIAREAGVSKATLYSYFPDKRVLFNEVAMLACQRMAEEVVAQVDENEPVEDVLTFVAREIIGFLTSPFGLQMFRICVAESDRFPELGRAFYKNGPLQGREHLAEYLGAMVSKGALCIDDIEIAAEQFSELCKTRLWIRAVCGVQTTFPVEEVNHMAQEAVCTFLARYKAESSAIPD